MRRPLIALTLLPLLAAALAGADAPTRPATQPAVIAKFPLAGETGLILLPVEFKGRALTFFLDTGATHMVYDESLRGELGALVRSQRVLTAGGYKDMPVYAAPSAHLGKLDLSGGSVAIVSDFAALRKLTGKDIRGAIGTSALRQVVLRLDMDNREVLLLQGDGREHAEWGVALPMPLSHQGMPTVRGELDGNTAIDFVLDTGATTTGHLPQDVFRQVQAAGGRASTQTSVESARGPRTELLTRVPRLAVGPFEMKELIFASTPTVAVLGGGFLRRYNTTFDFEGKRLYLAQSRTFAQADEILMSGMHIGRSNGNVVVQVVDADGPAARAGIAVGDILTAVDGKNIAEMDLGEINSLLRQADKSIPLIITRGQRVFQMKITLKRKI